jgi:uncharacterized membrane protein YpjA
MKEEFDVREALVMVLAVVVILGCLIYAYSLYHEAFAQSPDTLVPVPEPSP